MKVLWLASWYPNKHSAFEGDFIQRHARAAAMHHDVTVIYVNQSEKNTESDIESSSKERLTETRVYCSLKRSNSWWNIWRKHHQYVTEFKKAINQYIDANGLPDIVHVQVPMKAGIPGLWMKRKFNIPLVVSEHWGIYGNTIHDDISRKSFSFWLLTKRIIQQADRLITVSDYLGKTINHAGFRKSYLVIPNVVDTSLFNYQPHQRNSPFRFLHVSNLLLVKNPEKMLSAIAIFLDKRKDAEFVFIGNEDDHWVKIAEDMGLGEAISFKGVIPYEQVAAEMKKADALFLYSDFETFSCTTAEALSSGIPVITAHSGASPELVSAENGILCMAEEEEQLAIAFEMMIDQYDQFNKKQISQKATEKYGYGKIASEFDELYRSIV